MRRGMSILWLLIVLLCLCTSVCCAAEEDDEELYVIEEEILLPDDDAAIEPMPAAPTETTPRDDFINRIIRLGEELYLKADGKAQRAHYKEDIYVCKNFTVHLFRENAGKYRMAEYPDVPLVIPNNQKKADCAPYA